MNAATLPAQTYPRDGLPQPRTGDRFSRGAHEYIIVRPGRDVCRVARVEHDGSFGRIEILGRQYVRRCLAGGKERA